MAETKSPAADAANATHFRTCPLCEATCGLEITTRDTTLGREVVRIRGDRDDVFSKGFICPKGSTIKDLDTDANRVRRPLIKENGVFRPASWDEAFALIDLRLGTVRREHGDDAVAIYVGNPNAHSLAGALYLGDVIRSFRTRNVYSASTVDQMPKQISAGLMFGTAISVPVPDVDHTDYLLMLGANPYESNGSLFTAPDLPGRLEALRARGGKLVVVDPRRTKTADHADEHVALLPGTDALWLFALINVIVSEGRIDLGSIADHVTGLDEIVRLCAPFTPEAVAQPCGVDAAVTVRIARELCAAPSAAVYGRIGTCTQEFGTTASWLIDVLNVITANLDRRGGAMFTRPAVGAAHTRGTSGSGRGVRTGRWTSRVEAMPEMLGEFPVTTLPAEIETPGQGQVRAMIVVGGNPVSSNPDSKRVDRAIASLEFLVSVDMYVNETSRHADVILPTNRILTKSHFDMQLYALATRNVANWSPAIFDLDSANDERHEWETLLRLARIGAGDGPSIDVDVVDDAKAHELCEKAVAAAESPLFGTSADDLYDAVSTRRGPDRLLDISLRSGPYGAPCADRPDGLSLDLLAQRPHGIDFGAMEARVPDVLRTPSGLIELAPPALVADVDRLLGRLAVVPHDAKGSLLLIGRRHVRSNNSWMHNVRVLVKGRNRCTLLIHPLDAARVDIADGDVVRVTSDAGTISVACEVTDAVRVGVVSLPHGWGQSLEGVELDVATDIVSVNTNVLVPSTVDPLSGNAVLTGVRVRVEAA
jgi:anaerobic selenocysteine-containing dehydrogenase